MQRVNEFDIYDLAYKIHPLTSVSENLKYNDVWLGWMNAKHAIQTLFRQRSLEVCYAVANELYLALRKVVPDDFAEATAKISSNTDSDLEIGWSDAYDIRIAANKFETILSAELSNSDTYWISPKGTHKTSVLLQAGRRELPANVLKQIPEEAAADFDEVGDWRGTED